MTLPFTVTKPIAMCSSASRREQIPELEIYLFRRISLGFDAFGVVSFFLQCSYYHLDLHAFPTLRSSDLLDVYNKKRLFVSEKPFV